MNEIKQFKYDIAASLWAKPATIEELRSRDFLKNKSTYGIDRMLQQLENDDIVYYNDKTEVYSTYRKALSILNKEGYELS